MTTHSLGLLSNGASSVGWHWLKSAVQMAAAETGNWPLAADLSGTDWNGCGRMATRKPGATAGAIRAARHFTSGTLREWGVTARGDDIALVVSELLTNALRHASPDPAGACCPIQLGLLQPGPCILCAVADPSEQVPVPREPDYLAETGRGLHVISALSDSWGYTQPGAAGKVVWAVFNLATA